MPVSRLTGIFGCATCSSILLSTPSLAQGTGDASPASDGEVIGQQQGGLEEIIVTAQRKSERLQDVPIAITAVTGAQLAARGISGLDSLTATIPGLQVTAVGNKNTPFLRGVGSTCATPNCEASVATYIDGVYQASLVGNVFNFNNVERIEVLKGPQGTLFGRNSTGGVIQIITRNPVHEPVLEARLGYGNYQTITAGVYASTGLADNVAVDVSTQYEDQNKAWGRNITTGKPLYRYQDFSVRSKLLFTPSERTKIVLAGDFSRRESDLFTFQIAAPNVGLDGLSHRPGRFDADVNYDKTGRTKGWGGSLRVEQDLGFAQLVSITSRRLTKAVEGQDPDATPIDFIQFIHHNTVSQTTQELQLISQGDSSLQWTIGGYYYRGVAAYDPISLAGLLLGGATVDTFGRQQTTSYAGYAQVTYSISDTTRLTGGLRYTTERQKYNASNLAGAVSDRSRFSKPTWRIAIDQKLSRDVLVYASYNRGLKTGGFSLGSPRVPGFAPESLDAYELGLKSEFLNRRARFNIAGFYYDFNNLQVEAFPRTGGLVAYIQNAAQARIKGIDADLQIIPVDGLTLTAGAGYIDGRYRDFPFPAVFGSDPAVPISIANAAGYRTVRSPKFSGNASATYDWTTAAGSFSVTANVTYSDRYYFDVANLFQQDKYALVGASVTWWAPSKRFGATVWGRNLTDVDYLGQATPTAFGLLQGPAAPRTYGVTLMTKL